MLTKAELELLERVLHMARFLVSESADFDDRTLSKIDTCLTTVQRELDEIKPVVESLVSDTYDLAGA